MKDLKLSIENTMTDVPQEVKNDIEFFFTKMVLEGWRWHSGNRVFGDMPLTAVKC
jgi:hypothetical protein